MAKKSSKASSPSWRTLMRRAKDEDAAGKPKVAAALREKAATLRKKTRKPTSPKKTARRSKPAVRAKENITALHGSPRVQAVAEMREAHAAKTAAVTVERENAQVDEIMKLARKKGGDVLVMSKLGQIEDMARYDGKRTAEDASRRLMTEMRQKLDEMIVCGWIAEVNAVEAMTRGIPPETVFQVSSLTVVKLVDALNRAGYTGAGRVNGADRSEKREALMGKTHDEVRH